MPTMIRNSSNDAPSADDAVVPQQRPLVIVGAGPVGLCAALDLAQHGVAVLLITDNEVPAAGSRAVCYAKRSLEILDRLGVGDACVRKGLAWEVGRVYFEARQVYAYNLQPEPDHERPAFVNLQQFYLEQFLLERAKTLPNLEIRWAHRLVDLASNDGGVRLSVQTAAERYNLQAQWLVACDGAHSSVRRLIGAEMQGTVFRERFLIADVSIDAAVPVERRFWFDPPFHPGRSALLHQQPDGVWRVELELGLDAVAADEMRPEQLLPKIQSMFGVQGQCELKWVGIYTVACRRLQRLRHGRILFAGDAAHQVSPFGARGFNSGVQDIDNLGWKLQLALAGLAPEVLLDTYADERGAAADENIGSDRATLEFIAPASSASRQFRDAVLSLAPEYGFARRLVNAGRLSSPHVYANSLNTADSERFGGCMEPGAPAADAPLRIDGADGWFLRQLGGRFCGVVFSDGELPADVVAGLLQLASAPIPVMPLIVTGAGGPRTELPAGWLVIEDVHDLLRQRFDGLPGTFYLLRPDQHIAARWRRFDLAQVRAALARATAHQPTGEHP